MNKIINKIHAMLKIRAIKITSDGKIYNIGTNNLILFQDNALDKK